MRLIFALLVVLSSSAQAGKIYLGLGGAGGVLNADYDSPIATESGDTLFSSYSAVLGYQYDYRKFFIGIEAEYTIFEGASKTDSFQEDSSFTNPSPPLQEYKRIELNRAYAGHFLFGYRYHQKLELFGRAGYGRTYYSIAAVNTETVTPFSEDSNLSSIHGGLGARYFISDSLSARVEYRYMANAEFSYADLGDTKTNAHTWNINFLYSF